MIKPRRRWLALPAVLVLALPVTACESGGKETPPPAANEPATTTTTAPAAPADSGLYFYPPVEGATLEYKLGGVVSGTTSVTVDSVTEGAKGRTVTVTEKGTAPAAKREFVTRADGGLTVDIGAFAASAAGFTVEGAGEDLSVPPVADLEAGKKGTGRTAIEVSGPGAAGGSQPVTYTVSSTGTESVTVPAGTAEAYKIDLDLDLGAGFAGVTEASGTFWLKPGFGLVKQEVTISGFTLTSELTKTSVPL
ncbi:TapB family protein [Phytohabitans sp. LJ34]|uniref:TapB family protein n=1 Tax=Phytohabitans sp. LJ34 TaxID=3452217 RepID=UPI003F8ADBB8